MAKYIAVHSFKGGTGKSTVSANTAAALALSGKRVAVMDMDLEGPGIHVIFGVKESDVKFTLNDVLVDKAKISDAAIDLTARLGLKNGRLLFVPASYKIEDILEVLRAGFEINTFKSILNSLSDAFKLDYLLIDTHPGIENDTVLSMGVCDGILLVSRVDQQDILGTGIMARLASSLHRRAWIVFNMIPPDVSHGGFQALASKLSQLFGIKAIAALPFTMPILQTLSREVFVLSQPRHGYSKAIFSMAESLAKELPSLEGLQWNR